MRCEVPYVRYVAVCAVVCGRCRDGPGAGKASMTGVRRAAVAAVALALGVGLWVTVGDVESRERDAVCQTVTMGADVVEWSRCVSRCVESATGWNGTGSELWAECVATVGGAR
jgi:hypothetical protein